MYAVKLFKFANKELYIYMNEYASEAVIFYYLFCFQAKGNFPFLFLINYERILDFLKNTPHIAGTYYKMGKKVEFTRAAIVHASYMLYYSILIWRLCLILESFPDDYKTSGTEGAGGALAVVFLVLQLVLIISAVFRSNKWLVDQTWLNVPMFWFIIFSIGPYGMTLHHEYLLRSELSAKLPHASNTTTLQHYKHFSNTTAEGKSCFSVSKI